MSILITVVILFFTFDYTLKNIKNIENRLSWNEIDYVVSAEKGVIENIFEIKSIDFFNYKTCIFEIL